MVNSAFGNSRKNARLASSFNTSVIRQHERKIFSQNGEDGILAYLFGVIGSTNKQYVEFGVEDGQERNTRFLQVCHGWQGLLIDGGPPNPAINLRQHIIRSDTIHELFTNYSVPAELDLLSIDIDSCDIWVWRALCGVHRNPYRPRIVVVEFNRNFGLHQFFAYPDIWHRRPTFNQLWGNTLSAVYLAGRQLGYVLVYVDKVNVNAFFVRNDLAPRRAPSLATIHPRPSRAWKFPWTVSDRGVFVDYWQWSVDYGLPVFGMPGPSVMPQGPTIESWTPMLGRKSTAKTDDPLSEQPEGPWAHFLKCEYNTKGSTQCGKKPLDGPSGGVANMNTASVGNLLESELSQLCLGHALNRHKPVRRWPAFASPADAF